MFFSVYIIRSEVLKTIAIVYSRGLNDNRRVLAASETLHHKYMSLTSLHHTENVITQQPPQNPRTCQCPCLIALPFNIYVYTQKLLHHSRTLYTALIFFPSMYNLYIGFNAIFKEYQSH